MLENLFTGSGFWNPLIWVIAFIVSLLIVLFIRSLGKRDFRKDTEQVTPFLSGMPYDEKQAWVRSSNLYWGFVEAMKGYYSIARKFHSGDIRDYIMWFVVTLVITFFVCMGAIV